MISQQSPPLFKGGLNCRHGVKKPPINQSINQSIQFRGTRVVVCTDLSGKKTHRQLGMVASGLIPALGAIFPIFNTPMTQVNLPCVSLPVCMQLLVLKKDTLPWGTSVVVSTDLSGKESHRQVGIGNVVTSGSLGSIMARDVASILL